jgi:stalled ribosome rescue protein Dom34
MTRSHVAVWIDHNEARIFAVDPAEFSLETAHASLVHLKRRATEPCSHAGGEHFFDEIASALADAETVLVVGPSWPKLDFILYVHEHDHTLSNKFVGVETLEHPLDPQLAVYLRHYFQERIARRSSSPEQPSG